MTIACLVVEDQLPAQRILMRYISDLPHLELAAACGNAFEAITILHSRQIDLMFLDINLPHLGGFEFLKSILRPPKVIVTTAYPEHAVEAFDLAVVDYLVKPIAFDRFIRAVERYRGSADLGREAASPAAPAARVHGPSDHIFVKVDNDLRRIPCEEVLYLRGEGDYVSIITKTERLFVPGPMARWEDRLPSDRFARAHKSYIVNMAQVTRISGSTIVMRDTAIPIGRSYREQLLAKLGHMTETDVK